MKASKKEKSGANAVKTSSVQTSHFQDESHEPRTSFAKQICNSNVLKKQGLKFKREYRNENNKQCVEFTVLGRKDRPILVKYTFDLDGQLRERRARAYHARPHASPDGRVRFPRLK